jgi:hypothetical protein
LKALLEIQPYILEVAMHNGQHISHDFTNFRRRMKFRKTLSVAQAEEIGAEPLGASHGWLEVPFEPNDRIIIHRSPRYHNNLFPWGPILSFFGELCLFVGPRTEYDQFVALFGAVEHRDTASLLEVARLIAGSHLFIGNQSSPYAVCEGLKHDSVQETFRQWPDCVFPRRNAQFSTDDEISVTHPVTGEARRLQAPRHYFFIENASAPIRVGPKHYVTPKRTELVGGVWQGIASTADSYEAQQLLHRPGIRLIEPKEFAELNEK